MSPFPISQRRAARWVHGRNGAVGMVQPGHSGPSHQSMRRENPTFSLGPGCRVWGIFGWQLCAYGVVYCITTGMIPNSNWVVELMLKNIHDIWNIWIYLTIFVLFSKKFHFDIFWLNEAIYLYRGTALVVCEVSLRIWWTFSYRQSIVCPFAGNSGGCLLGNETCHKQIDRCIAPVTIVPLVP